MPMKGKTFTASLSAVGSHQKFLYTGETFMFTQKNSCYIVAYPNGEAVDLPEGTPWTPDFGFTEFFIKSTVANDTCTFIIVDGDLGPRGSLTSTEIKALIGTAIEAQWTAAIGAGLSGTVGGWLVANTKAVWLSVDPAAANGLWIQSSNQTQKFGLYVAPGVPVKITASADAGSGQGKVYAYNPGAAPVSLYAFVEYV